MVLSNVEKDNEFNFGMKEIENRYIGRLSEPLANYFKIDNFFGYDRIVIIKPIDVGIEVELESLLHRING